MSQSIQIEAHLLLLGLATGAVLMMIYDVLRVARLLIPHGWLMTGVEDLIYWCMSGFVTFYLLYRQNDGNIRMYVIGSVILAMIVYDRLISRFFLKLLKKAGRWIRMKVLS